MTKGRIRLEGREFLDYPTEVDSCRDGLEKLLRRAGVSFAAEVSGHGVSFRLSGPSKRTAEAGGQSHTVLPFLQSRAAFYWVSIMLRYEHELGDLNFRNATVVVFRGLAESEKEPLLRAEWDRWPKPRPHAQPHWHVYRAANSDDEPSQGRSVTIVHLAMAATWHHQHAGDEPHYCEPTGEGVARWIQGCLRYVRSELEFLSRKQAG